MPTLSQVWGCSSDKRNLSRHGAHNLWGKTNQDNNININSLSKWKCKGLRRGSRVPGGWDATGSGEGGFRNIQGCLGQVTHTQFWLPRWLYLIFSHHTPLDLLWLHTAVYVTAHSTGTQLPAPEDTPWPQRVLRAAACVHHLLTAGPSRLGDVTPCLMDHTLFCSVHYFPAPSGVLETISNEF